MRRIIAVAAIAAFGCDDAQSPVGPSGNGQSIRGQVLDFSSQAGLPDVVVELLGEPDSHVQATTDAAGFYVMPAPGLGSFSISVDRVIVGAGRGTGFRLRGDLLIDRGRCISRYGAVANARTLKPIRGATVTVGAGSAVTGSDGWYRVDLGCPASGTIGFNTTFLYVTHPAYGRTQYVVGRGIQGVRRLDIDMVIDLWPF